MRALRDPDAFPCDDPDLRHVAGARTKRELERRSQTWRPWRAYAAILLWQGVGKTHAQRSAFQSRQVESVAISGVSIDRDKAPHFPMATQGGIDGRGKSSSPISKAVRP